MKRMTTRTLATLICLGTLSAIGQPTEVEVAAHLQGLGPAEDLDWSGAGGIEAQMRFWQEGNVALALCAGVQSWDAVEAYLESDDGQSAVATEIRGSTDLVPVGVSFEGGLRYAFTDSDVTVDIAYVDDRDSLYTREVIEVEDTFLALAAADIEFLIAEGFRLSAGIGYQFDLTEPNESVLGADLGPTDFSAIMGRFGLSMAF
jgi:hypothetical protein